MNPTVHLYQRCGNFCEYVPSALKMDILATLPCGVLHPSLCWPRPRGACTPKNGIFHFTSWEFAQWTLCSKKMGFAISLCSVFSFILALALSTLCLSTQNGLPHFTTWRFAWFPCSYGNLFFPLATIAFSGHLSGIEPPALY